jgi:hypothetical protein
VSDDGSDLKGEKASTGYRRAPRASQYRKGQSGNPTGRPKGIVARKHRPVSDRLNALMLGEAYRPVKVNENGKEITMPLAQAVFRSLGAAALKGEARAQAMFINILSVSEEVKALADAQAHADAENAEEARIEITIVDPDGSRTPYRTDGSSEK